MSDKEELSPVAQGVAVVLAVAAGALTLVLTVRAFADSIGWGLVWLVFIDPILLTVCWWVAMVILLPVSLLTRRRDGGGPT